MIFFKTKVTKSQPSSSSVHVPSTEWEPPKPKKKSKEHNSANIESLREAFNRFLDEEEIEQGDSHDMVVGKFNKWLTKDKLTAHGRDRIKDSNFALPEQRKYPIHDIGHARDALARASGKPEESKVRAAVHRKYPSLAIDKDFPTDKQPVQRDPSDVEMVPADTPVDPDTSSQMEPPLNNQDAEVLKDVVPTSSLNGFVNPSDELYSQQKLIQGIDRELMRCTEDPAVARVVAESNIARNPNYYTDLEHEEKSEADPLGESESPEVEGLKIDLGSGNAREDGYIGFDVFPYDHGTIPHDLNLGIPLPDHSASNIRMGHLLEELDNPQFMLQEIQRVLMPGGTFVYEGPTDLGAQEGFEHEFPGLVLVEYEDNDGDDGVIGKDKEGNSLYRQTFTGIAQPDPATANDAAPRIGLHSNEDIPADARLALGAMDYTIGDASTSGPGNRAHGYPSQGATLPKDGKEKSQTKKSKKKVGRPHEVTKEGTGAAQAPKKEEAEAELQFNDGPKANFRIAKADGYKQIVYGVVLAPNEVDSQEDWISPEDIEKSAHGYLESFRTIKREHTNEIAACPVESYIAPQDFQMKGQYGPQVIKKGSWVLAVKVNDPDEWQKIVNGTYSGFSVGGLGLRDESNMGLQDDPESASMDTSENPQ